MAELIIKDRIVLYDADNEPLISPFKWGIRLGWGNTPYVIARINGKNIPMHRHIMKPEKGFLVDHKNHNTLDNRKENLRICTRQQNMWNRKRTCGTSKFKGVYWCNTNNKWISEVTLNSKKIYLGRYKTETEAAKAYNAKAKELFGEFACLNHIGDLL